MMNWLISQFTFKFIVIQIKVTGSDIIMLAMAFCNILYYFLVVNPDGTMKFKGLPLKIGKENTNLCEDDIASDPTSISSASDLINLEL